MLISSNSLAYIVMLLNATIGFLLFDLSFVESALFGAIGSLVLLPLTLIEAAILMLLLWLYGVFKANLKGA